MLGNKYTLGAIGLALLGAGAYVACDPDQEDIASDRTAEVEIVIHPGREPDDDFAQRRLTAVLLGVDSMEVHHLEEGWVDLGAKGLVNLLAPEESIPRMLGTRRLPDGLYDELRLRFDFAAVEVGGVWFRVTIPSGEQTGFKVHTNFCLVEGETTSLDLDWNVARSVHHNDEKGWWVDPSIEIHSPPTCTEDLRTP